MKNFRKKFFPLSYNESALHWLPFAVLFLALDLFTKYLAVKCLSFGVSIPVFPMFNLTLVYNYGAAFGFLNNGEGWHQFFFSGIAIVAGILFFLWLARLPRKLCLEGIGLILLISGALGNFIDRLVYGYVIDFLDFYWGTAHWPAFNLADSFICIGAVLVLLQSFRSTDSNKTN